MDVNCQHPCPYLSTVENVDGIRALRLLVWGFRLALYATPGIVIDVLRPTVVEKGEQVVAVAGRGDDGRLHLSPQVAVAFELPVGHALRYHWKHVDVLSRLLRRKRRVQDESDSKGDEN